MSTFIDLLRQHQHAFKQRYSNQLSRDMHHAIYAMLNCKTAQQNRSKWVCGHCDYFDSQPLSCGNRNCPQCQSQTTSNWLAKQQKKLLPVHYFMATFTLPYELRALAKKQPKQLYQVMFRVVSSILKDFAKTSKLGKIGFTAVLHTHSRKRDLHPHLHVIIASGGYEPLKNQWKKGNDKYLFNAFALAKVWRARLLDTIKQHDVLRLPKSVPKKWVVDCRKVGYGLPALQYLSRYLYKGVLSDKDITTITENSVTFKYIDGKTKKTHKRTLPILEFLWLILQHVLPKGLQRVRDYGFLHGGGKATLLRIQIKLLALFRPNLTSNESHTITRQAEPVAKAHRKCPCCQHEMKCIGISRTTNSNGYNLQNKEG
jgi:hypothetical protein